jgi:prophage DNA circulation protein
VAEVNRSDLILFNRSKREKVTEVDKSEHIALIRAVEPHRNELVEFDGEFVPKSVVMLMSALADEQDAMMRFEIYGTAILHCGSAGRTAAAVKLAHAQYQEFRDIVSLMTYSNALAENGEIEAGVSRAKEALQRAIQQQTVVNYAAENLVRQSIKTRSVEAVNEALDALADSTNVPREGDCALEADWVDAAEALGADPEMISWGRKIAERRPVVTRRG